jgi:hypothetical protein
MTDETYQTKVYHKQDGDKFVVASGGGIDIESGGYLSVVGDFYFDSLSAVSPTYLGAIILNRLNILTVTNSAGAGSGVLSVVSIPARTGHVIIKASGACSNGSMQLYSCYLGEELFIYCNSNATLASVSVAILASGGGAVGVSLIGIRGSTLSRVRLDFSAQQSAWVQLRAIADACWAVVNSSAYVTEDASA